MVSWSSPLPLGWNSSSSQSLLLVLLRLFPRPPRPGPPAPPGGWPPARRRSGRPPPPGRRLPGWPLGRLRLLGGQRAAACAAAWLWAAAGRPPPGWKLPLGPRSGPPPAAWLAGVLLFGGRVPGPGPGPGLPPPNPPRAAVGLAACPGPRPSTAWWPLAPAGRPRRRSWWPPPRPFGKGLRLVPHLPGLPIERLGCWQSRVAWLAAVGPSGGDGVLGVQRRLGGLLAGQLGLAERSWAWAAWASPPGGRAAAAEAAQPLPKGQPLGHPQPACRPSPASTSRIPPPAVPPRPRRGSSWGAGGLAAGSIPSTAARWLAPGQPARLAR